MHRTPIRALCRFFWLVVGVAIAGCEGPPDGGGKSVPGDAAKMTLLQAEVDRLRTLVPDQAHAMSDVADHFANLWFAGKAANWPLAEFYWKETLSHLRWAVRIIPVRKDSAGREVKLEEILESIEKSPHLQMGEVIAQKDASRFEATYRRVIEGCYSCHKASDKPFLRPTIPSAPAATNVEFHPAAEWPR